MVGHGVHGAERRSDKKGKNIKNKHIKCGSVEFEGPFLVIILARQNCISSNAFLVYPIPFLQYQFFQDMVETLLYV
jgi:hypothetical protein